MCGRFAQAKLDWPSYFELFGTLEPPSLPVSFNIKPTQDIAIAYMRDGEIIASPARWWFVPHWHRGNIKDWKTTTFNAKIETAYEKPTFRTAWRHNRCIIPATGYYEWTGSKGSKQPHYITVEQNVPVFFFAGLYSTLGDGIQTTTIMTAQAAPEIVELHHRMPVILPAEQIEPWMACDDGNYGWTDDLKHHPVKSFGIKDDGAELIIP
ncbi:MAG: SOS response-associated peptidase [Amylibacter sp.]